MMSVLQATRTEGRSEKSWPGGGSLSSNSEIAGRAPWRWRHLSGALSYQTEPLLTLEPEQSQQRKQQVQMPWGRNEFGILEGQGESSVTGAQEVGQSTRTRGVGSRGGLIGQQ